MDPLPCRAIVIGLCFLLGACGNQPVLSKNAVVLDNAVASKATVTPDRISFSEAVVFDHPELAKLDVGNVLVSGYGPGFIRKVVSVISKPLAGVSPVVLATQPASLADVLVQGSLDTRLDLTQGMPLSSGSLSTLSDAADGLSVGIDVSGTEIYTDPATHTEISLSKGSIIFRPSLDLKLAIADGKLNEFSLVVNGQLDLDVELQASLGKEFKANPEALLWIAPPQVYVQFIPTVPPVPVVEVVTFELLGGVEVDAQAGFNVTTGVQASRTVSAGAEYKNGQWNNVDNKDFTFNPIVPTAEPDVSAQIRAYLKPDLEIQLYGLLGPSLTIEPYAEYDLQVLPPPASWKLVGGVTGEVDMKLEAFDIAFAEYKQTLFNFAQTLAASADGGPDGGLVVPDGGFPRPDGGVGDDGGMCVPTGSQSPSGRQCCTGYEESGFCCAIPNQPCQTVNDCCGGLNLLCQKDGCPGCIPPVTVCCVGTNGPCGDWTDCCSGSCDLINRRCL